MGACEDGVGGVYGGGKGSRPRGAQGDCEIVPWVWVYVPLENREGTPLAARLDLVAMGRVEGICVRG